VIQHYFGMLLVFIGSGTLAWFLLDWLHCFPADYYSETAEPSVEEQR